MQITVGYARQAEGMAGMTRWKHSLILVTWLSAAFTIQARAAPVDWPDDAMTRIEALALLQTLNAQLLASRSATLTLERWCEAHRLAGAGAPQITAHLMGGAPPPATPEQRQRLGVGPGEPLKYRRVELRCGERVLSVADNWYVPSRLTPEMNRVLETTDTPFGKAVLTLQPARQTFAASVL